MKRTLLPFVMLFTFLLSVPFWAKAQKFHRWSRYKKEFGLSLAGTVMLGDLGGTTLPKGVNLNNRDMAFGAFFKYRIHNRFALKASFMHGDLYASDFNMSRKVREERGIKYRSLDARTRMNEISGQVEYYIIREKVGSAYPVDGVKGYGRSSFAMYVFAGVGLNMFDVKGYHPKKDKWLDLPELNTEGQGLPGGPTDYSTVTLVFPLGGGIKYNITENWGVQLEGSWRITTTDYLDDVSGKYFDGSVLEAKYGEDSRFMAEKGYANVEAGTVRGGPAKDAYMVGSLSVTYRIRSKAKARVRL